MKLRCLTAGFNLGNALKQGKRLAQGVKGLLMMRAISLVVIMALLMSGCASMFHGTKENIHVRSDEPGTVFFVNNREIGKGTSASTTIPKKRLGDATLMAKKAGCLSKSSPVETQFDGITLLGILIDLGIVSILIVDWGSTGAVTKAAQTNYILTPDCTN